MRLILLLGAVWCWCAIRICPAQPAARLVVGVDAATRATPFVPADMVIELGATHDWPSGHDAKARTICKASSFNWSKFSG
jgi:hypothetical protein